MLRLCPRRTSKKDSPAKLAGRMKRRWRIVLCGKGELLGTWTPPMAGGQGRRNSSSSSMKSSATGYGAGTRLRGRRETGRNAAVRLALAKAQRRGS